MFSYPHSPYDDDKGDGDGDDDQDEDDISCIECQLLMWIIDIHHQFIVEYIHTLSYPPILMIIFKNSITNKNTAFDDDHDGGDGGD